MKKYEYTYTVGAGHSDLRDNPEGWTEGTVKTPHGLVEVYAQGDDENFPSTTLNFQIGKRVYVKNIQGKRYTHRGIATQAKRFSKEVTENSSDGQRGRLPFFACLI